MVGYLTWWGTSQIHDDIRSTVIRSGLLHVSTTDGYAGLRWSSALESPSNG